MLMKALCLVSLTLAPAACRADHGRRAIEETYGPGRAGTSPVIDHIETMDCTSLDYGIYWLGTDHRAQKAGPGATAGFYSPQRPTLIYAHGWQPSSVAKRLREDLRFRSPDNGQELDLADIWLNQGWNVGVFYWPQLGDEEDVRDAERKIWSLHDQSTQDVGMRWRQCDGSYTTEGAPTTPLGEAFFANYRDAMHGYEGHDIRFVGHSLGNQMVTRLADQIDLAVHKGEAPLNLQPTRIALLDPWWSLAPDVSKPHPESAPPVRWHGPDATAIITRLVGHGVLFERYQTSDILAAAHGDANDELTSLIGLTVEVPAFISSGDPAQEIGDRHGIAPKLYFLGLRAPAPPGCRQDPCVEQAPSAALSNDLLRLSLLSPHTWHQVAGRRDRGFCRRSLRALNF